MNSKLPPIPNANRSTKGPGEKPDVRNEDVTETAERNPDKVGQQGNSKVNTTHQGYQQDR
jgi:hypothetical protein